MGRSQRRLKKIGREAHNKPATRRAKSKRKKEASATTTSTTRERKMLRSFVVAMETAKMKMEGGCLDWRQPVDNMG